jgi:hypothetical protein
MALIGNYSVLHKSPCRFLSGTIASGDRGNFNKNGMNRNKFQQLPKFSSVPNGYSPGYSYVPAQNGGGLASYKNHSGSIYESNALLAGGVNVESAITGAIILTDAQLDQIANLLADLSASVTLTEGQLAAVAALIAAFSSSGTLTDAQLGAIVGLVASLAANGQLTDAVNFATAEIAAEISSQTPLSPESLAASVWNSLLTDFQGAGTMGEALNTAGSGGLSPEQVAMLEFINLFAKSKI